MIDSLLAAVQLDPGGRGLAHDPVRNLFTERRGDFAAACRSIAEHPSPAVGVVTGFYIAAGTPPAGETDGPLGAAFLVRAWDALGIPVRVLTDPFCVAALAAVIDPDLIVEIPPDGDASVLAGLTHLIALERPGPAADGRLYSMRGRDITDFHRPAQRLFGSPGIPTIGIGDGGNEIGMGAMPADAISANIPLGGRIACRTAVDHLIVAGVSNWGAYALAAGVCHLRGRVPAGVFDADEELSILERMVAAGPLVDGVTGVPTATVDGLAFAEYIKPLGEIRRLLGV